MPRIVELKPAITIDQQIELLQSKGLVIDNKEEASLFLINNNYYRLNVYFHKLMNPQDHFIPGTKFSKIVEICKNDSYLRRNIISILEPIEIKFKTRIAYFLGRKYGSDAFYRKDIYKSAWITDQILHLFWKEISWNKSNPVISHHYTHYSGYFPIWVVVEFLTFNSISKYYSNLQSSDQKIFASEFFGINEYFLSNWIHSLSVMRNICAHYGYLYKREYTTPISFGYDSVKYKNQGNTMFGIFYSLRKLAGEDQWGHFYNGIINTIGEQALINDYNFPVDLSSLTN
ncbi:MAG: Abi family protein [Bellilinea sp.]